MHIYLNVNVCIVSKRNNFITILWVWAVVVVDDHNASTVASMQSETWHSVCEWNFSDKLEQTTQKNSNYITFAAVDV